MLWVCDAGHITPVNLNLPLTAQRPGGKQPPYGAVCHCGRATWPMIACTERQFQMRFRVLKRHADQHAERRRREAATK